MKDILQTMYEMLSVNDRQSTVLFINFSKPHVERIGCKNATCIYIAENEEQKIQVEKNINRHNKMYDAVMTFETGKGKAIVNNLEVWMKKKKFDCCIMNPPYNGNLHLKILEKVIPCADKVVNISPVRWLQDPLAFYKKGTDFEKFEKIRKNTNLKEIIDAKTASKLFGIDLTFSLGIYDIETKNKGIYTPLIDCADAAVAASVYYKILDKIVEDNNYAKLDIHKYDDGLENYVCAANFSPESKYGKKRLFWLKEVGRAFTDGYTYRDYKEGNRFATRGDISNTECIVFPAKTEAINCYDSFKCKLPKFICMLSSVDVNVYPKFAPWMSDYKQPWNDKRFCEHFGITGYIDDDHAEPNSEWETILNTMKNYE